MMDFSIRESRNTHAALESIGDVGGEVLEKRIVIGSAARLLEQRKDDKFAYQWRIYIRDEHDEDLSNYMRKVVFRMHPDCAQPIAIKNQTPFEVINYGNDEFQITITILYNDMRQSCTIHHHDLKLSEDRMPASREPTSTIVNEKLESITFVNPTAQMKLCLKQETPKRMLLGAREYAKPTASALNDAQIMMEALAIDENWPENSNDRIDQI